MNLEAIVAVDKKFGIAKDGIIPWNIKEDLSHFYELTTNNVVIMGKNTYESLPKDKRPLRKRINIVISSDTTYDDVINLKLEGNMNEKLEKILKKYDKKKHFVIGGEYIYKLFKYETIHLSFINKDYECDKFFDKPSHEYQIKNYKKYNEFTYIEYIKQYRSNVDTVYCELADKIMMNQREKEDRTGTGTVSLFGEQIRVKIGNCIPILTTKRVPWKSCIEELLWFMRGDTDANILKNKGVNIWNANSSQEVIDKLGLNLREGDCGANYSFQWKHYGDKYINCETQYNNGVNQIDYILDLLKNDPDSRRIFMSAWNPCDINKTVLPPCHVSCQFYVYDGKLSCHMYQRSCDVFLGLPWNILSYSVLTYILALKSNLKPKELIISFGDVHIYKNHIDQMKTQINRNIISSPVLEISDKVKDKEIKDINIDDFDVIGYFPHPSIKGVMAV